MKKTANTYISRDLYEELIKIREHLRERERKKRNKRRRVITMYEASQYLLTRARR